MNSKSSVWFLLFGTTLLLPNSLFASTATLFCSTGDSNSVFAAQEISNALTSKAYGVSPVQDVSTLAGGTEDTRVVLAKRGTANVEAALAGEGGSAVGALKAQGYSLRKTTSGARTTYWVVGADATGTMYGGLDLAEAINLNNLGSVANGDHAPYILERGIKFNIPLDVRTPSYSDNGEAAWKNVPVMWDINFWMDFLDDCARYHYNALTLWSLQPFPSLINVPEYPAVALSDVKMNPGINTGASLTGPGMCPANVLSAAVTVKTMTINDKIAFWKQVMQYGKNRGVDFYIFNWNIFTYGADGKDGITTTPGAVTTDYFRKSVRTLLLTYPLLAGIGVTYGENIQGQTETWLWDTYGQGVKDAKADPSWQPGRKVRFIHRAVRTSVGAINSAFGGYPDTLDYSYKYSEAHMLSSADPTLIDSWLPTVPAGKKTWLTVRNDDMYMMRWGDPEFARAYIANMPQTAGKLEGFYMGPDGYTWGREFISTEPDAPRQSIIRKMWYSFMAWGRLAYDNNIPSATFTQTIANRFPEVNSADLYDAWASVSKVLPMVTRFHWSTSTMDYQWYPEACAKSVNGFHTITDFAGSTPLGPKMMSISQYKATPTGSDTTPVQVAQYLQGWATSALQKIAGMNPGNDKELRLTIGDIRAMAYLGQYYSEKILAATYKTTGATSSAVTHAQLAAGYWRKYASTISSQYLPQVLTRIGPKAVDVKALMTNVLSDITLAGGSAQQVSAQPTSGGSILEAEAAQTQGGSTQTATNGFTGTGYVNLNANGVITWTYTAPKAGIYLIEFRYAINSGSVPVTLSVNGNVVDQSLSFWTTGNTWQAESRFEPLAAGVNTISIKVATAGSSIDHMNIVPQVSSTSVVASVDSKPNSMYVNNHTIYANVTLSAPSAVSMSIFDLKGRAIKQTVISMRPAGESTLKFDVGNVSHGFYVVKVSYNDRSFLKTFFLDR